jgi:acyl-coenzyme A synthetase/AMP-(fatty) acid ligase
MGPGEGFSDYRTKTARLLLMISTQWKQILQMNPAQHDTSSVRNTIYTGEPIGKNYLERIRSNVCDQVYPVYPLPKR